MRHALIIEGDYLIAMMLEGELAKAGYSTADIATSEEEAIRFAAQKCPDLITVDESLECGSGIAAIRHICRNNAIPVVFITAEPDDVATVVPDAVVISEAVGLARQLCAEHGMKIGLDGVQLLGGHGFVKEHPVERWYRDLRAVGVMEGAVLV